MVAGVFVRVFNEQPAFPLADPAGFCKGLVTYVHAATRAEAQQQQQQQQEQQGGDAGQGSHVATPEQQQQVGYVIVMSFLPLQSVLALGSVRIRA